MDGNRRFVRGERKSFKPGEGNSNATIGSQHPFATVLGCSDSRVPPELIFDVGIGDLFVSSFSTTFFPLYRSLVRF
jgi:carbonic anhydrase